MNAGTEIFMVRLAGCKVFDPNGDHVGKVHDVVLILSPQLVSRAVGFVVEVYAKRRVFIPLSRITSITPQQIIITGLLNMRRFDRRELESLGYADFIGRVLRLPAHKTDATRLLTTDEYTIEDFAINLQNNGEWIISKLFIRKIDRGNRLKKLFKNTSETRFVDFKDANFWGNHEVEQVSDYIVESMENLKPADAADVLMELEEKRQVEVATDLDNERLADVLEEMPEAEQLQLLENFDDERIADVLDEMQPDDAADLLKLMPANRAEELLDEMQPEEADDVRQLLEYSKNTAGGLMTTNPVILTANSTVGAALAQIRREELSPALASIVFVSKQPFETPTGQFLGILHFQQLLRYPPATELGKIIDTDVYFVYPTASIDEVARVFATYNALVVPVLDTEYRLLGAISVDDVIDHMLPVNWRENELLNGGRYADRK